MLQAFEFRTTNFSKKKLPQEVEWKQQKLLQMHTYLENMIIPQGL